MEAFVFALYQGKLHFYNKCSNAIHKISAINIALLIQMSSILQPKLKTTAMSYKIHMELTNHHKQPLQTHGGVGILKTPWEMHKGEEHR